MLVAASGEIDDLTIARKVIPGSADDPTPGRETGNGEHGERSSRPVTGDRGGNGMRACGHCRRRGACAGFIATQWISDAAAQGRCFTRCIGSLCKGYGRAGARNATTDRLGNAVRGQEMLRGPDDSCVLGVCCFRRRRSREGQQAGSGAGSSYRARRCAGRCTESRGPSIVQSGCCCGPSLARGR